MEKIFPLLPGKYMAGILKLLGEDEEKETGEREEETTV